MPVPYLAHPSGAIPIDIGRQLFVDDFLIEQTTLIRVYRAAKIQDGATGALADDRTGT